MKADLNDTASSMVEDEKFLADLDKTCKTKQAEWDERCKVRNQEFIFRRAFPSQLLLRAMPLDVRVKQRAGIHRPHLCLRGKAGVIRIESANIEGLHGLRPRGGIQLFVQVPKARPRELSPCILLVI